MKKQLLLAIAIVLGILTALYFIAQSVQTLIPQNEKVVQYQLVAPFDLHKEDGSLKLEGWLRSDDNINFDYRNIDVFPTMFKFLNRLRYKGWDYYYFKTHDYLIGFSVADVLGVGGGLFCIYNMKTREMEVEMNQESFDFKLAPNSPSKQVTAEFHGKIVDMKIDKRDIEVRYDGADVKFNGSFHLHYERDRHEAVTTIVPMTEDQRYFFFATKKPGVGFSGNFTYKGQDYKTELEGMPYDMGLGFHDHGRGVWPYFSGWIWGSFITMWEGHRLGLNFGYGFSDPKTAKCTEDALYFDGQVHKLGLVQVRYNDANLMEPWEIESIKKAPKALKTKINLVFEPHYLYKNYKNRLVVNLKLNQVFGEFRGTVVLESQEMIELKGVIGFVERNSARW